MSEIDTPLSPSIWKRTIRVVCDAIRGFIEDDCYSKASALTFYSLLSIVPVLAVFLGIAKGFGFEQALELEMRQQFVEQSEVARKLIEFSHSWLRSVQGGLIAGVGTIALFWSVFGLLSTIESTLNEIWKIPFSRPYNRRISDYLAAMIVGLLFFVTSSSLTVFLSTQILQTDHDSVLIEAVSPLLVFILKLFPFFLSCVLFTFIYLFMPNTKVYLRSGLIAGIIGGIAFQVWQWLYIKFQIGASNYGSIYGSFAALPLFLIWLQFSWLILLAGAELAFELENDLFMPLRTIAPISSKTAALLVTLRCVEAFMEGKAPQTDRTLAHELGMSLNHLHTLLEALQKEKILSAVSYRDKTIGYQPAKAVHSITFHNVCAAIEKQHHIPASVRESQVLQKIQQYVEQTDRLLGDSPYNHPISQLSEQTALDENTSISN